MNKGTWSYILLSTLLRTLFIIPMYRVIEKSGVYIHFEGEARKIKGHFLLVWQSSKYLGKKLRSPLTTNT